MCIPLSDKAISSTSFPKFKVDESLSAPLCWLPFCLCVSIHCYTGLKPDTLYQYQCGDPYIPAMSEVYYFRTMPVSGPKSYPNRIALVGDLGLTYNTTSTVGHLMSNHPDLVLLVGDVTYANLYLTNGTGSDCYSCSFSQTPIHETYQPRWDYWGRWDSNFLLVKII